MPQKIITHVTCAYCKQEFGANAENRWRFRQGRNVYCCREHRKAVWRKKSPIDRFMAYVEILSNGCWEWVGPTDPGGYGKFFFEGRYVGAHRWAYEYFTGKKIPDGLDSDHVCHIPGICNGGKKDPHRRCVNPAHIKPSTRKQNCAPWRSMVGAAAGARQRAKNICAQGHELTEENTWINPKNGWRYCRTCRRIRSAEYYYRQTGAD